MNTVLLQEVIVDVQPGFASGDDVLSGVLQVRMNNVDTNGSLNWEKTRRVMPSSAQLAKYALSIGDVLFNSTNSPTLVGKTALFTGLDEPVVFSNHFFRIRTVWDRLEPAYLVRWLNLLWIRGEFEGVCTQWVNQASVRKDDLLAFKIPLPSLDEQRRVVAILDKADALRRKRAEALRLTDQLLQSVFLDMFGDPVTNPKGWETVTFGDKQVGTLDRGRSRHRPRNAPELLGGPYPLIQTGDAANCRRYITKYTQTYSEVGLQQSKMWPAGTLCITIAANIAKTGILTFDACFPDSVVGFTPGTHVTTEYVQFWLSFLQSILEDSAPESAQKNINLEILRKQEIPLPDRRLQDKFTEIVKKTDSSMVHMDIAETEACNLFDSTTQRAFRGEL